MLRPEIKPIDLYLFVSLSITLAFLVCNIICHGSLFRQCVLSSSFLFSDYYYHIAGSSDPSVMYFYGDPYSFPPFAYLLYTFLWSLSPYKDAESILNWQNYRDADNAMVVFVVYNMALMILLLYCIGQYFHKTGFKHTVLLPLSLLLSYPFMCTSVQRGNIVILAALLLALTWIWIDSDRRIKQEFAMLFIAVCAGFKLYPALTGIIYLKRKEWKKAIRLMLYGAAVIFVPFLFFGGLQGMKDLVKTLTEFAVYIDPDKTNTVCGMAKWLGLKLGMNEIYADTFAVVVNHIFLAASLLCFFLCSRKWQEALFISGVLVSYLPSNWQYTLVYYVPVLFLFFQEYDRDIRQGKPSDTIWMALHAVGFGTVFSVSFFLLYYRYGFLSGIFTITYLLIGINMLAVIISFLRKLCRKRKFQRTIFPSLL